MVCVPLKMGDTAVTDLQDNADTKVWDLGMLNYLK